MSFWILPPIISKLQIGGLYSPKLGTPPPQILSFLPHSSIYSAWRCSRQRLLVHVNWWLPHNGLTGMIATWGWGGGDCIICINQCLHMGIDSGNMTTMPSMIAAAWKQATVFAQIIVSTCPQSLSAEATVQTIDAYTEFHFRT